MNKIQINDVKLCVQLLTSVCKIIPSCKFVLTKSNVTINAISEGNVSRSYFESDCMCIKDLADEEVVEFSFNNIVDLLKSIKLIIQIEELNEVELSYDEFSLRYKNNVKFKLNTCKPDLVEQYYTDAIKAKLTKSFSFKTSESQIKQLLSCINICSVEEENEVKIYLEQKDDSDIVIGEIADKQDSYSNSMGLPIGKMIENSITEIICMRVQALRSIMLLSSDNIKVAKMNAPVLQVDSEITGENGFYLRLMSILQLLKV